MPFEVGLREVLAVLGYVLTLSFIPIILARKRDPTAALGWCLTVAFLPYLGVFVYLTFGNTRIHRRLERKRQHGERFAQDVEVPNDAYVAGEWDSLAGLAGQLGAYPTRAGNTVEMYTEGVAAFEAMYEAIDDAQDHLYVECFIWKPDEIGLAFIDRLAAKAAQGLRVRVLYDDVGSLRLKHRHLRPLLDAGGVVIRYPSQRSWRRRLQVTLRNHRKLLIADGVVGFTGGLNFGKEYVHHGPFPFWRDTHVRIAGPAAQDLERAFIENWDFVTGELLPAPRPMSSDQWPGRSPVQIVAGGPDQEINAIHALYFAAITRARERLWIMSPYFIPDPAIMTALRVAARLGVDVRLLTPQVADHWLSYFAAHYYWDQALESGVRIFRYQRGMMHSKVMMVDGVWSSVGTANLDIRSLQLNFEINAVLNDAALTRALEAQFLEDLEDAEEMNLATFRARPLPHKVVENLSRLFSPIL